MEDLTLSTQQFEMATRFGAVAAPPSLGEKVGISADVWSQERVLPLNGLRHPAAAGTSGWFIWCGEEIGAADDFFIPLHIEHLKARCPEVLPYLALPPGWRFLLAPGHEDVWFDKTLLAI
jgi:hypothetical protein